MITEKTKPGYYWWRQCEDDKWTPIEIVKKQGKVGIYKFGIYRWYTIEIMNEGELGKEIKT